MNNNLEQAYFNLGKILFESNVASHFGIEAEQTIDFNNPNVLALLAAIKLPLKSISA